MKRSNVYDCTIIELDKHHSDRKGNITVVEIIIPYLLKLGERIIYMIFQEERNEGRMRIKNYSSLLLLLVEVLM